MGGTHFINFAVQEPAGVMVLEASYGRSSKSGAAADFNPYFGTDVGICSIVKPQLSFNDSLDGMPFWEKLFKVRLSHVIPSSHQFFNYYIMLE